MNLEFSVVKSFECVSGECFGLLGTNGAGKTTTFKMLTGDVKFSSGEAFVHGINLKSNMTDVHKIIGYCPQFDGLLDELTGAETLQLFASLHGIRRADISSLIERLAIDLNFMEHIDKKVEQYSAGNKRKLSTAVALIGNAVVIYLGYILIVFKYIELFPSGRSLFYIFKQFFCYFYVFFRRTNHIHGSCSKANLVECGVKSAQYG